MTQTKSISMTAQFKRDLKKHYLLLAIVEWVDVLGLLVNGENLPEKYQNHPLKGDYKGYLECHIRPDLLLIYKLTEDDLTLVRLGTHSELF